MASLSRTAISTTLALILAPLMVFAAALPASASQGVWPVGPDHRVVQGFSPPEHRWGSGHRGVDLAGRPGQAVLAALAGTVTFVGKIAGKPVVVVSHGSRRTTYEPVLAVVTKGRMVDRGQQIGTLTTFQGHCLPRVCLHWGLIEGEQTYLDPMTLLGCGRRPVRLLPVNGLYSPAGSAHWPTACGLNAADPSAGWLPTPSTAQVAEVVSIGAALLIKLVGGLVGRPA